MSIVFACNVVTVVFVGGNLYEMCLQQYKKDSSKIGFMKEFSLIKVIFIITKGVIKSYSSTDYISKPFRRN